LFCAVKALPASLATRAGSRGGLGFLVLLLASFTALALLGTGCQHPKPATSAEATEAKLAAVPELDPLTVQAQARYMAGVIHDLNREGDAAIQDYTQAAEAQPADDALVLEVSDRLLAANKFEEALKVLSRAASQPAVPGEVLARLGSVQATLGKTNEAVATARRALSLTPAAPEATRTLFLLLIRSKQFEAAHEVLGQALAQTNLPPEFLVGLSEFYLALSQAQPERRDAARTNAVQALERAYALQPADPDLRNKLADGFFLLGQPEKASQIYLDLLKQYPDNEVVRTSVRAKLIETYLRGKDRSQAAEHLEQILRDNPSNAQAYFVLGGIAFEQRDWNKAVDLFGKAVLFSPGFEPAYYDLALAQVNTDDPVAALRTLEKSRDRFGETFSAAFIAGLAESVRTNYTAAVKQFTAAEVIAAATDKQRLSEQLFFQLGAAHERLGNFEQAARYFEKALELEPEFAEAMNYLGYMWAERGENLERAHQLLQKAVQLQPKNPAYLDSLAWVLFKLGKPAEALPHMDQAIELTEKPDPTLYDHLGDIQAALGQPARARAAWQRALELDPGNEKLKQKLAGQKAD
jgi:tetratricopeptide (TPR) repeat protein